MRIHIERTNKINTLAFNGTVAELLKKLKINKEEVLVIKGDEVVTEDEELNDKDEIKLLSVISGG